MCVIFRASPKAHTLQNHLTTQKVQISGPYLGVPDEDN